MSTSKKQVLIITYYFPPSGGAGVQRTLKFIKYLRDFGWQPIVLTARNADYPAYDKSLFSEVPDDVKVYRSRIFEPYRFYRKFTGRKGDEATDIATLTLDKGNKRKFSERISEWIRATFFIPDARIGWLFFAYNKGKEILRKERIDVLFSSAPPYTTHLIGLKLKKYSNLPWIADFRDSWIGWLSTPQWRPSFSRAIEKRMEHSVLRNADRILTVTRGVKQDLLSRNPEFDDSRWVFLPNGYDLADFENVAPVDKTQKITVIYIGSLYGPRNPESLLQALEVLQKNKSDLIDRFMFRFVGRVGEPILKRITSSSVSHLFEMVSYVTHKESVAYLLGSDVSLLIIDDIPANRGILTGKLFEYIGAGKPILALAPEGEAADLIRQNNLGIVVPPNDVRSIQRALQKLAEEHFAKANGFQIDWKLKKKFERRELTRELAKILNEV